MNTVKEYILDGKAMVAIPVEKRVRFHDAAKMLEAYVPAKKQNKWFSMTIRLLRNEIAPCSLGGKGKDVTVKQLDVIERVTQSARRGQFTEVYDLKRTKVMMSKKELEIHEYWRDLHNSNKPIENDEPVFTEVTEEALAYFREKNS